MTTGYIATKNTYGDLFIQKDGEVVASIANVGDETAPQAVDERIKVVGENLAALEWFRDEGQHEIIDSNVLTAIDVLTKAGYTVEKVESEVLRTWERLEDIPDGTPFTSDFYFLNNDFSSYYISNGDGTAQWEHNGRKLHRATVSNSEGPFHEVPKEFRK